MPVYSFVFLLDRHLYISLKTDNFTFLPLFKDSEKKRVSLCLWVGFNQAVWLPLTFALGSGPLSGFSELLATEQGWTNHNGTVF